MPTEFKQSLQVFLVLALALLTGPLAAHEQEGSNSQAGINRPVVGSELQAGLGLLGKGPGTPGPVQIHRAIGASACTGGQAVHVQSRFVRKTTPSSLICL